jgi:hypothetical protein
VRPLTEIGEGDELILGVPDDPGLSPATNGGDLGCTLVAVVELPTELLGHNPESGYDTTRDTLGSNSTTRL